MHNEKTTFYVIRKVDLYLATSEQQLLLFYRQIFDILIMAIMSNLLKLLKRLVLDFAAFCHHQAHIPGAT